MRALTCVTGWYFAGMNNGCVSLAVHTIGLPFPTDGPPAATVWHRRLTAESDAKLKKRKKRQKQTQKMAQEESDELRGAGGDGKNKQWRGEHHERRTLRKESPKKIESAFWRWMLLAAVVPDKADHLLVNRVFVFLFLVFLGLMIS